MTLGKLTVRLSLGTWGVLKETKSYCLIALWNRREFFKVHGYHTVGKPLDGIPKAHWFWGFGENYWTIYRKGLKA